MAERGNAPTAQRGNVMVIILIGIVLFAALAYAIKSGSAPASGIRTAQEAQVVAGRIIEYGNAVEATVNQMMAEGVMVHQLDFGSNVFRRWMPAVAYWADNPNCVSNTCRVFRTKGGSLPEVVFYPEATGTYTVSHSSDRLYPGHAAFHRANVVNIGGATANDIVMQIAALSTEVCDAINSKLGLPLASTQAQEGYDSKGQVAWSAAGTDNYWSLDAASSGTAPFGDNNTSIAGKTKGCTRTTHLGNVYFHVLVAR